MIVRSPPRSAAVAAAHDAEHDRDATFVTEAYDAMRDRGYLAPRRAHRPGWAGATMRQLVLAQHELARIGRGRAVRRRCTCT